MTDSTMRRSPEQLEDGFPRWDDQGRRITGSMEPQPLDMLLFCPKCHTQHVDEPDERTPGWMNPPHRSHLCHACGTIWRPADVATNGVRAIATRGKADTWPDDVRKSFGTQEDKHGTSGTVDASKAADRGVGSGAAIDMPAVPVQRLGDGYATARNPQLDARHCSEGAERTGVAGHAAGVMASPQPATTYTPSREVVQQALELVDRIRDSHESWGGWSGIPQTCERIANMLRYGNALGVLASPNDQQEQPR